MFKWFWTIFSLGAPGTCSITGGEFKSSTRTTLSFLTLFRVWIFPVLFACIIKIPVFYLVYTRLFWVLPFSFPASFIMPLQFVFWLVVSTPCWLYSFRHLMVRYFHVHFAHCSLFFRLPFDFLSVIVYLLILSHCRFTLGFLYNFLVTTWSRFLLIKL